MPTFTLHWSRVPSQETDAALFVLWPSPVNPDACFKAAGFTEFGDADADWDANADRVLDRLLDHLRRQGEPRLVSAPILKQQAWYRRGWCSPTALGLREQIELPLHWDGAPDCIVAFGTSQTRLRTGNGHHLFWVTLPAALADDFPGLVIDIAAGHPVIRTDLDWAHLS